MSVYPPELKEAAKNLLDNQDFAVLLKYRMAEIQRDIMDSDQPQQILDAHNEHAHVRGFAEWIQMLGDV